MLRQVSTSFFLSVILTILTVALLPLAGAQVMTSPSYQLQSDSVNVGGGLSSSTNYIQESTVGEIATGPSDSTSFSLRAGYQQMQEVFLSMTAAADVTMSPSLGGITGGESNGSTTVTVITDAPAGYRLTIESENDPAMQQSGGSGTIDDYNAGGTPDFTFTFSAGEAVFGYSPTGVDVADAFLDDGGTCNTSTGNTDLACWDGLTTSAVTIVESSDDNHPLGSTTTVNFRVGVGSGAVLDAGLYIATTTLTAFPL